MKKFMAIVIIWSMLLMAMITGNAKSEIGYQIRYDSHTERTYPMKKKIQEIYRELISGVHQESYILMVLHNKELFAYKKDIVVSWQDNMLYLVEGDGNGDEIQGTLSGDSVCVPEVQPRSFLADLWN